MSIHISGFSDEISDNLDQKLAKVISLSMKYISLRGIDGKNVADYDQYEGQVLAKLKQFAQITQKYQVILLHIKN